MKTFFRKYYNHIHWATVTLMFIALYVHDSTPQVRPAMMFIMCASIVILVINSLFEMLDPNSLALEKEKEFK